jgi:hypothetical protein
LVSASNALLGGTEQFGLSSTKAFGGFQNFISSTAGFKAAFCAWHVVLLPSSGVDLTNSDRNFRKPD